MRNKTLKAFREDSVRKAEAIYNDFHNFTDGWRVLFLIHRAKEGAESANNDKIRKIVTKNSREFIMALTELVEEQDLSEENYRIYSSLNARDINKGIQKFKQDQLEADYYDEDSKNSFYTDVKNRFVSALMVPSSRSESLFLFDCDSAVEYDIALKDLARVKAHIIRSYPTKNGWHVITEPFNHTLLDPMMPELKKDALLLLSYKR